MKKFLTALAVGLMVFGGQANVDAATVDMNAPNAETQDMSKWSHFRDKYILDRNSNKDRYQRERKDWKRRHRHDNNHSNNKRRNPTPPPRNGNGGTPPMPPPPVPGYGASPQPGYGAPQPGHGAPPPR